MPNRIVNNGVPTVDKSGNVTIVTTITAVYSPQEFLALQGQVQKTLSSKQTEIVSISAELAPIQTAAAAVTAALAALSTQNVADAPIQI